MGCRKKTKFELFKGCIPTMYKRWDLGSGGRIDT